MADETLVQRHLVRVITGLMGDEPVIVLNGARTVGKSTLLRAIAEVQGRAVFDLDDPVTLDLVRRDPSLVVGALAPVLIDEFQHVPELLQAIKAELNKGVTPGRYVITGSTRYLTTPTLAQSLTGRVSIIDVWPFSQGELLSTEENFLNAAFTEPEQMIRSTPSSTTRDEYRSLVIQGGLPLARAHAFGRSRDRWYRDYVQTVLQRDVLEVRAIRQRELLPQVLRCLASRTGQILNYSSIARDLRIDPSVARDYGTLLDIVFLTHRLHAWGRTLGSRVGRMPKVHLVDSGLGASLLGINEARLASAEPSALTEYGHLVETFAVNEILKQSGWSDLDLTFGHFRTRDDHEVDLVAETADGRIIGVEVKAGAGIPGRELAGLQRLRDLVGPRFVAGIALYAGNRSYTYEDRLHVLPMDSLWRHWAL